MAKRYQEVAEDIKRKINKGEITDIIPPYRLLVRQYHTSFATVVKVMEKLRAEEVVITDGRGSYVNKAKKRS